MNGILFWNTFLTEKEADREFHPSLSLLPSDEVGKLSAARFVVQSAPAVLILLLRIPAAGYHGWVMAADTCKYRVI